MTPLLTIKQLKKSFGGVAALQGIDLALEQGKVTALIGPNGSGKSTLFHLVAGLLSSDSGEMVFQGESLSELSDAARSRLGISRTFQELRLFPNLTILDHCLLAENANDDRIFKNLFAHKKKPLSARAQNILAKVGLQKEIETEASSLSYGQSKLLGLALALLSPHSLLMLDEPVAGVNPELRTHISRCLQELRSEGETILLIEHDMNFVMGLSDRIVVLDAGKVIADGKPKEILSNPRVLQAYLGSHS
jgi:ABC-type branched-subunit amino acid transport system ATPase component